MVRKTIIRLVALIPVVIDDPTGSRHNLPILFPTAKFLENLNLLFTATFQGDDVSHSSLNRAGTHKCCAPGIRVRDRISTCMRSMAVIKVNDLPVLSIKKRFDALYKEAKKNLPKNAKSEEIRAEAFRLLKAEFPAELEDVEME